MELRKWPRRNDPESIKARQAQLAELVGDGEVFWDDLQPWARSQEAVTGVAVVPVSVIGPLDVSLGIYELEEPWGGERAAAVDVRLGDRRGSQEERGRVGE